MGIHVIVVYTPRPGKQGPLEREVAAHVPTLRRLGLATDEPSLALRSEDGSIVESFEWASRDAMEGAHEHPDVVAMWHRFEVACSYGTLGDLPNANSVFAEFKLLGRF